MRMVGAAWRFEGAGSRVIVARPKLRLAGHHERPFHVWLVCHLTENTLRA
jgi:hypothetical protein